MKQIYMVECWGGEQKLDTFLVFGEYCKIDDIIYDINDTLAEYNKSDDDLIGHPMERTLRDIRGVSQHRMFVETMERYPQFEKYVMSYYKKLTFKQLEVLHID